MVLYNQKAQLHTQYKLELPDGSRLSVIIWLLPQQTNERPHGYKYRLNFATADGIMLIRYDNKTGKGDHKHIGEVETPYKFQNIEELLADFLIDVRNAGGQV